MKATSQAFRIASAVMNPPARADDLPFAQTVVPEDPDRRSYIDYRHRNLMRLRMALTAALLLLGIVRFGMTVMDSMKR